MNQHTTSRGSQPGASLAVEDLEYRIQGWIYDGEARMHSPATITNRKRAGAKLLWFLGQREYAVCGLFEVRAFLAYLNTGHQDPLGRWGEKGVEGLSGHARLRAERPMRPASVRFYFVQLRALFNWLVAEGALDESPMARLAAPIAREDQITPFTTDEMNALLDAAERGQHSRRDAAIVRFLYDTGVRASELCALTLGDLEIHTRRCIVHGKGGKDRSVYYGVETWKALAALFGRLRTRLEPDTPLFATVRGPRVGEALTRGALLQLLRALGRRAKVPDCHPHRFRHTFAIEFLRSGGNQFTLMSFLGHTSMAITARYVKLAQADLEAQHRAHSPGDRLKRPRRR